MWRDRKLWHVILYCILQRVWRTLDRQPAHRSVGRPFLHGTATGQEGPSLHMWFSVQGETMPTP